jgi:hypothetical protein
MNRNLWLGLLVAGALSGGCIPTNFVLPTGAPAADKDKSVAKPGDPPKLVYRPPITADQVNAANAKEKAQALREELEWDLQRPTEAGDAKDAKK